MVSQANHLPLSPLDLAGPQLLLITQSYSSRPSPIDCHRRSMSSWIQGRKLSSAELMVSRKASCRSHLPAAIQGAGWMLPQRSESLQTARVDAAVLVRGVARASFKQYRHIHM